MRLRAHAHTAVLSGLACLVTAVGTLTAIAPAQAVAAPAAIAATSSPSGWTPRGEDFPGTTTVKDLAIPMSDGTILRGDVMLPADSAGNAVAQRFPVVVTITAYNKNVQQNAGGLAGGDPSYLVKRGYAQLTVDARGTGNSAGQWCAFCTREDTDSVEILQWAHQQAWSNGNTAMAGPSYMGINQFFAAAGHPDGLKALFPQVPGADVYRDVVASGGQIDIGFIPLWLGLVTFTGLIPPSTPPTDATPLTTLVDHLMGGGSFTLPLVASAFTGGDPAYDGPFYTQRSPINVVNQVDVPTFLISGEYDLFQRGTPLLFENLQKRGIPTKMIIGPWNHLQGSSGAQVVDAGHGSLSELQLRWFDHYVKGIADPGLDGDVPPITYYEQGTGAWKTSTNWVGDRTAVNYRLSGSSITGLGDGALTTGTVAPGSSQILPIPVAGLCSRSTQQWTAGLLGTIPIPNPCDTNNSLNDHTGVVFRTAPVTSSVAFQGPLNARLYVSSTSGDGMLSVAVEDEAPDGTVSRLSGGWQVISLRALDPAKSRYLDGSLIQPYHPFTQASQQPLAPGQIAPVDVEIFPTGARILPGHRLRIAIQAFDVPHLAPTLPDLLGTLTVLTIHDSAAYPSVLTIPALAPVATRTTARVTAARTARIGVTGAGTTAVGLVRLWVDGVLVGTRTLTGGRASARIPARLARPGVHRLRVSYLGASGLRPSGTVTRWRVR